MSERAPGSPSLAIVIVSYETPDLLRQGLASIAASEVSGQARIVVIDNSTSEGCAEVARSTPGVTLIRNPKNVGYAKAVNQGLAATDTDFALVLNPDIQVERGAITRLLQAMAERPAAGLAGAKLLNPDRSLQTSCRRFYTPAAILLRRTFLGRLFPNAKALREHLMLDWDHGTMRDVDWLIGACLLVRRRALEDVGPMDERYFLYFEDVDWCARMHHRGWEVLYVPDAVMVHHHRRESAKGSPFSPSRRMHLASVFRFYEKWSLLLYLAKRYRAALRGLVIAVTDLVALNGAFLLAFEARRLLSPQFEKPLFPVAHYWQFLLVFNLATLVALRRFGLYRPDAPAQVRPLAQRVGKSILISALAVLVATFLLYIRAYSRFVILLTVPLAAVAILLGRLFLGGVAARLAAEGITARRVLVVGDRALASRLGAELAAAEGRSYEVVGTIPIGAPILAADGFAARRVSELCHRERVQELVLADRRGELTQLAAEVRS
ncbi:MAG TPA: glycosyltransferase, partial [Candidatus Udaeobacter sp.]|nr:glycosyltransferase [Candidatus Udaeobacter sp.]